MLRRSFFLFVILINLFLFAEDNFYQIESEGYFKSPIIRNNLIFFTDNYDSAIYCICNDKLKTLVSSPGCGRYFNVSEDGNKIGFKFIDNETHLQTPAIFDVNIKKIIFLHEPAQLCSQVYFVNDAIYFMIDKQLFIHRSSGIEKVQLTSFSNLLAISHDEKNITYRNKDEQLVIYRKDSNKFSTITDIGYSFFPINWSNDDKFILIKDIGENLFIYDTNLKILRNLPFRGYVKWYSENEILIVDKKIEKENYRSELFSYNVLTNKHHSINTYSHLLYDFDIKSDTLVFSSLQNRSLVMGEIKSNQLTKCNLIKKCDKPIKAKNLVPDKKGFRNLDIPYINQMYDTPQGYAHNYGCCAAATASMALMYYKIFPHWDTTNSSPYSHTTHWGNYIGGTIYQYRGIVYNNSAYYESGAGWCYNGIDNYHWDSGSPNSRMRQLIENHGITSVQHWTSSCTYSRISGDVANNYPYPLCVTMTASGHLILAKGIYDDSKKLLYYHDPYGNKNTTPYLGYDGDNVIYDWPGENNGYANLVSVAWSVSAQGNHQASAELEIDDLQLAYGSSFDDYSISNTGFYLSTTGTLGMRYWRGESGGMNGTYWWTGAMAGSTDDYFSTWRPDIVESGTYEIEVYIPAETSATTSAQYQIHHNDGTTTVPIDQSSYSSEWVSLGEFQFRNDNTGYLYLGDATGAKSGKRSKASKEKADKVIFDAVRFSLVDGATTIVYNSDFESDNGGMTANVDWNCGVDAIAGAHSGSNVWGTILNGDYNNSSDLQLDLSVSLGDNSILTFYHWMEIEDIYKAEVFDGGNVKISTNGGSNFNVITPEGGYPHTIKYSANNPLSNQEAFSGISSGWEQVTYDLSAYPNENVIIRWHFGSDGLTTEHGWYIDDVNITDYPENPLPVTLSNFTGICNNKLSTLKWITQSEINNSYWNVYRSPSENFGQSICVNATPIPGAGTVFQPTNYEYSDFIGELPFSQYYYWIESVDLGGTSSIHAPICVFTSEPDNPASPPVEDFLYGVQNYPNPFNPTTVIKFSVNQNCRGDLCIFNTQGQMIYKLYEGSLKADEIYHKLWDGKDSEGKKVSSGFYIYQLKTDSKTYSKRMLLLK